MAAICLVGAGRIGLPVAHRLVAAGHSVEVVDVDEGRRAGVEAAGARWGGPSLGTVPADCVLVTVLPGSPELRRVMLGSASAGLSRLAPGTSWVDLTSAAPDLAAELAAAADSREVRYIDAAVGGGPAEAARGELTLYIGGEEPDVERLRPILQAFADPARIFHMGNSGAGYLTKLLVNQLWFGQALAVTEALLLAAGAGLPPDRLAPVLRRSPASSAFVDRHLPALLAGDYLPSFGLDRVVEELDSLARLAETAGVPWPVSEKVAEVHRQALAHFGDEDGELLGAAWLEHAAGRRLADMRTVI